MCGQSLASRLSGYILLQVESKGEAWYVYPEEEQRYYLGRPEDAFAIMRELGLGIKNENLSQIPIGLTSLAGADNDDDGLPNTMEEAIGTDINNPDSDNDGFNDKTEVSGGYNPLGAGTVSPNEILIDNVAGKILLQVESKGEAWYIYPKDRKRSWPILINTV